MNLTAERLRTVLSYEPLTGVFRWKEKTSKFSHVVIGQIAGGTEPDGRRAIRIDGHMHWAHRLVWLYMKGDMPMGEIDHINGDPGDNRWSNLRLADRRINCQNHRKAFRQNRTGLIGVTPKRMRFEAGITVNGRRRYLGSFATADEAHAAYVTAKRDLHEGCTL